MPFKLIKGTFHVVGYSPDGDSIRFQAVNNDLWNGLSGPPVSLNGRDHAQLRLEGIDTLETHYSDSHQPDELAMAAMNALMVDLGIGNVIWNSSHTMVQSASDGVDGYILCRAIEKNHRPVAFAFNGTTPQTDGSPVFLDGALLRQSVNYQQIAEGMAFPTYYKGLFFDLRAVLTQGVQNARGASIGLWPFDRTQLGAVIHGQHSLEEDQVVIPKLFRRLTEYLAGGGGMGGFKQFLESKEEGIIIISTGHATHFDTVIEVDGITVRMTVPPEDIMFEG